MTAATGTGTAGVGVGVGVGVPTDPDPVVTDLAPATLVRALDRHGWVLSERWARIQGGFVRAQEDLLVTIVGEPVAFTNGIQGARFQPDEADGRIAEVVDVLRAHGVPATWWVGPDDSPTDLGQRLEAHGFRHDYDLPWMACGLEGFTAIRAQVPLQVQLVDGPEAQARCQEAMRVGFGMEDAELHAMARLGDAVGYAPDAPLQRFVGLVEGRAVASSGAMLGGGIAGIYSVSTAPALRGRGIGAAMTSAAMLRARELGYRVAMLGSAARALPLYRRIGFRPVCTVTMYLWEP
ncbi:MAG: GNAT family N-acetyltransferase [Actinomycetota bacterium]|nr:GNAT family N-acetyltransferase [Actinomycetota bacterium]